MQNTNEIIKANKKHEGKPCNICKEKIALGDLIHICNNCMSINHESCWQNEGGCKNFSCYSLNSDKPKTSSLASKYKSLDEPVPEKKEILPPNMIACRWCGAPILRSAKICKHCNEYQNEADKKKAEAEVNKYNYNSIEFSGFEWTLMILFSGIALLYGVYIYISGNTPKGIKIIKYSTIIIILLTIIRLAFNMMMATPH